MHYVQMPFIRHLLQAASAAAAALLKGIAVHALLLRGLCFVRSDADNIQCAEILTAKIVAALLHGAVNVGVLVLLHNHILLSAAMLRCLYHFIQF